MADAESCPNCDGLTFYIDNLLMTPLYAHVLQWKVLEFNVTPGVHDFLWAYTKDYSVSRGTDRAYLQFIELHGTAYAQESCSLCPPGTSSASANATWCAPCGYNQFNPNSGQTSCQQCSPSQSTFQGATSCNILPVCTQRDIFSIRGPCNPSSGVQTVSYQYMTLGDGNVNLCDPTSPNATRLPASYPDTCYCSPGSQLDVNGICQFCSAGQATNSSATCMICVRGPPLFSSSFFSSFSSLFLWYLAA